MYFILIYHYPLYQRIDYYLLTYILVLVVRRPRQVVVCEYPPLAISVLYSTISIDVSLRQCTNTELSK